MSSDLIIVLSAVASVLYLVFCLIIIVEVVAWGLNKKYYLLVVALLCLFFFNKGLEVVKSEPYTTLQEKLVVSTSASKLKTEGSFLFFSGYIDQNRFYLLREEVHDKVYKDFEVQGDVFIRESDEYTNKGLFIKKYSCFDKEVSYTLFFKVLVENKTQTCKVTKQEIVIPVGSVIKELKI